MSGTKDCALLLHPLAAVTHLSSSYDWESFEHNLQAATDPNTPTKNKPYNNVHVIMYYFKEGEKSCHAELKKLEAFFGDEFNFNTIKVGIEEDETQLSKSLLLACERHSLFQVYYP